MTVCELIYMVSISKKCAHNFAFNSMWGIRFEAWFPHETWGCSRCRWSRLSQKPSNESAFNQLLLMMGQLRWRHQNGLILESKPTLCTCLPLGSGIGDQLRPKQKSNYPQLPTKEWVELFKSSQGWQTTNRNILAHLLTDTLQSI